MTTWVMIVASINFLIATFKLFGEARNSIGSTWVITSGYMVWYVIYGLLLISLGILSLFFVNGKDVRATVLKTKSMVIFIRILALAIIAMVLFELIDIPRKFGTTITLTPRSLILNLVFDFVAVALSFLTLRKAEKFRRLQKNQK